MQRLVHDPRGSVWSTYRGHREYAPAQFDCAPILGSARFFQGIDEALLRQLAGDAARRVVARDAELFRQDDPSATLFMVVEGNVKLVYLTPEGGQVVLGLPYPATAVAASDAVILSWPASYIFDAIAGIPQLSVNALAIVSDRADEFMSRMREMAQESVDRRLARNILRIIERQAAIGRGGEGEARNVNMPRRDLADLCGTTLFTVSRILQTWERAGIVKCGRRRVTLLNSDQLSNVATGAR
jgi:CRP-like cAMP-binding protein